MVGVINQKWRDTMALLGGNFTKEERAAGWPESFKPERIAVLQRPFKWWPIKDREHEKAALYRAYKDGLNDALTSGELTGTATTVTVTPEPPPVQCRNEFASSEWLSDFGRFGLAGVRNGRITSQPIPQPRDVTTYAVTAPAFATWLAAKSETPSVHIQNWFDARGESQAPATPAPVAAASDGLAPLTTSEIAGCFAGFHGWDAAKWKSNLQTPPQWLKACRHQSGNQGKPITESTWWPVQIAAELDKKHPKIRHNLHARFKIQEPLKPWFDAIQNHLPDDSEI